MENNVLFGGEMEPVRIVPIIFVLFLFGQFV
jgi:hypothetical protein